MSVQPSEQPVDQMLTRERFHVGIRVGFRLAILTIVILVFMSIGVSESVACPNCKDAIANESQNVQQGYILSILLMMGTPFAILVGWLIAIIRMSRNRQFAISAE